MAQVIIQENNHGTHVSNNGKTITIYDKNSVHNPRNVVFALEWHALTNWEDDNIPEFKFASMEEAIQFAKERLSN